MLVAIAIMIGSFRETVIYWVAQTLRADLYVSTRGARTSTRRPPSRRRSSRQSPAIRRSRRRSLSRAERAVPRAADVLGSGDFRVLLEHGDLVFKAPADGRAALRSAIGRDAVVVSESLSLRFGVRVGDRIDVPTPAGPRPFRRRGVLRLLDRPRRRGDGSRDVRAPLRRPAPDQPERVSPSWHGRRSRARGPDARSWPSASGVHPHQHDAARRGAADLRRDLRHHVRPGGHRDRRGRARRDRNAGDADPRTAPRAGDAAAGRRRPAARSGG